MANTYTQIYIQCVFAVKHRDAMIIADWESRLHAYIGGIIKNQKHKPLAINGMPDHIHLFFGYNPTIAIPDAVSEINKASTEFIREDIGSKKFQWQEGYGAFSYSRGQLDAVCKYIENQKMNHQKRTFKQEYLEILGQFGIEYEPQYLFEFI
jgi:putative transposase